ncbi:hypothetical protein GTZ99_02810 [Novosphingobium sp. FSY-8]|uniref:YtxH-like protein n=1 Tax=Novosphingobium ovatum TaxID=1908523 RepID=A0ABW9XAE5_9SPHN|nr:hypothetical protein [Novosphingobium ovatum]NBC35482.1 hypothetical protein [Novosphingobium ovatum]
MNHLVETVIGGVLVIGGVGLRLLLSPRLHRSIHRSIRQSSIEAMEHNLALYEQAKAARAKGQRPVHPEHWQ